MPYFSEHRRDPVLLPESFHFPFGAASILRCDLFRSCQPMKDMLFIFKNVAGTMPVSFSYVVYHVPFINVNHFNHSCNFSVYTALRIVAWAIRQRGLPAQVSSASACNYLTANFLRRLTYRPVAFQRSCCCAIPL